METDLERLKKHIERLYQFNATPNQGCTRFSYSKEDQQARDYLIGEFKALGLKVSIDAVGNIRARLEGSDPEAPVVMSGSHIDTVLHGGKFDGVVGVVGALEAVRAIIEQQIIPNNPIEVVIFAEEEGSNFGSTLFGSKALTGKYQVENLKNIKNDAGLSSYQVIKNFGLEPDQLEKFVIKPGKVKAMIEMHVEQGAVLDSEGISIGVVEAIAGSKWYRIEFQGVPNHAGATPMHLRRDPMVAAATIIAEVKQIVKQKAFPTTVGTVGKISCQPNIPNCIPEKVTFTLDVRDVNPEGIEITVRETAKRIEKIADLQGVKYSMELMGESDVIHLSKTVVGIIEQTAREKGINYKKMNSGAVHDSSTMASITDVGMIFVPSINGRSHVPEESTNFADIKTGADLLLGVLLKLCTS